MTRIRRHPAPPALHPANRPGDPPAPLPGGLALLLLALLAGAAALVPVRGDVLGFATGALGVLVVLLVLPRPELHPVLALTWTALAFALPVTLALTRPGLPLGAALAMGAVGVWVVATLTARRLPRERLPKG